LFLQSSLFFHGENLLVASALLKSKRTPQLNQKQLAKLKAKDVVVARKTAALQHKEIKPTL
jgi:hypothetical protein